jgi:hypothetical protein
MYFGDVPILPTGVSTYNVKTYNPFIEYYNEKKGTARAIPPVHIVGSRPTRTDWTPG